MSDESVPMPLDMLAMEGVCSDTRAGWLWYCDEHDSHGNADSEGEAWHVGEAHSSYAASGDEEDGGCQLVVWQRVPQERVR